MNSALEDVVVLERALESCGDRVEAALPEYERLRADDTKALVRVRVAYPLLSTMILVFACTVNRIPWKGVEGSSLQNNVI